MIQTDLIVLLPELALLALACLLLVVDTYQKNSTNVTFFSSELCLLIVIGLVFYTIPTEQTYAFHGTFISDSLSVSLKILVCFISLFVFYYADSYFCEHGLNRGEYYILGLFSVLGMMIMISAASMITIYLGLELMSLCLYAMVAMNRNSKIAAEAAMKYFIMGAIASGLLLYGISIIYGVTGSIHLVEISQAIQSNDYDPLLLTFALVFIISALAFKLGAAPFHMWVPDVYHGAPTGIVLFISTAPKIAGLAIAIRILGDGFLSVLELWQPILISLATLSIALGNIVAIAQTNIKRMLAYSTISHMGFVLLGLLSFSSEGQAVHSGFSDAMFYVLTYALMSLGAFGMVVLLGRRDAEANTLEDFQGLSDRNPWFAFIMLVLMFSLAGVPPFVGFWAKLYVLTDLVDAELTWLAVIAVFFSIIGAYYYLRIVKLMYFDNAKVLTAIKASQTFRALLSGNGLAVLFLGLFPGLLMSLCVRVFS